MPKEWHALVLLLCCCTTHALRPANVPPLTPQLHRRTTAAPSLCASSTPPPKAPDAAAIRRFAIPALGLWLNAPLLSLVDTSAVGLSALPGTGATQLAALGPATTFCDGAIYLFAFLNVATTNLYASASADSQLESEGVVRCAARVALLCGLGAMLIVLTMGTPLLKLYVGGAASADAAILRPAAEYIAIRSLSFPAAFLAGVLRRSPVETAAGGSRLAGKLRLGPAGPARRACACHASSGVRPTPRLLALPPALRLVLPSPPLEQAGEFAGCEGLSDTLARHRRLHIGQRARRLCPRQLPRLGTARRRDRHHHRAVGRHGRPRALRESQARTNARMDAASMATRHAARRAARLGALLPRLRVAGADAHRGQDLRLRLHDARRGRPGARTSRHAPGEARSRAPGGARGLARGLGAGLGAGAS